MQKSFPNDKLKFSTFTFKKILLTIGYNLKCFTTIKEDINSSANKKKRKNSADRLVSYLKDNYNIVYIDESSITTNTIIIIMADSKLARPSSEKGGNTKPELIKP